MWATILTVVSSLTVWSKRQQKKKAIAELDKRRNIPRLAGPVVAVAIGVISVIGAIAVA